MDLSRKGQFLIQRCKHAFQICVFRGVAACIHLEILEREKRFNYRSLRDVSMSQISKEYKLKIIWTSYVYKSFLQKPNPENVLYFRGSFYMFLL